MKSLLDTISVECPRCGNQTMKEIRWLHAHAHWTCERCNGWLQFNLNELDKFVRDEADNFRSKFRLKKYPEEPL